MAPSMFTAKAEGTFADQVALLKLPLAAVGAKPTFYYAVGTKKENVSDKKALCAAKGGSIVHSGAIEVRRALKLGSGPLSVKTSDLPAGVTLFVQSTSATRKLKAGETFVVDVDAACLATSSSVAAAPPVVAAAAAGAKRSRSAVGAGTAAAVGESRKATLLAKRSGKFWACREGVTAPPQTRVCPAGASFEDGDPFLECVDGGSGKVLKQAPSYCDTEMFDEPDFGKPFRPMADEVRKWRWVDTYTRPDKKPAANKDKFAEQPWTLIQILEPQQRRHANAEAADNAWEHTDDPQETDGSYVEVWGRSPRQAGGQLAWDDIVVLAQFGPHPLYCACVGGHPFVQTAVFSFSNSDGSTEAPPQRRDGVVAHPLELLALAEMYCCQQEH